MTDRKQTDDPNDARRRDETSRQRAYDEAAERVSDTDRGMLRDDGQPRPTAGGHEARIDEESSPVYTPDDERHPNAPDTLMADMGAKPRTSGDAAQDTPISREELEDSYSEDSER
jgi:hypothetical protein